MKNKENEKYLKIVLSGLVIVAFGILLGNSVFNGDGQPGVVSLLLRIVRPFLFGGVIAYLVTPLARWLARLFRGKCEGLANVLALLFVLLLVIGVILLIVPQLISSIIQVAKAAPAQFNALMEKLSALLNDYMEKHPEHAEFIKNAVSEASAWVSDFVRNNLGSAETISGTIMPILAGSASSVTDAFVTVKDLLIGIIVALYFLSRRAQLAAQSAMVLRGALKPAWTEWIMNEAKYADRMFNGFFMGKLLDSAIIGLICFVGCLVMGFASPLLIAVIVGVTNIIPFFGPLIGAIPCTLLLLLENPTHALMFVIFVVVLQQLDGNVIGPKILGDSTGLSSLWVMFGILFFGGLWGILGMLIGVPLMAVIYDVIRQLTYKGMRQKSFGAQIEDYNRKFHPPATPKKKSLKGKA